MSFPKDIDFEKYLEGVVGIESEKIISGDYWNDAIVDIAKNGITETGTKLPWPKTHPYFRLRGGEITAWSGFNSHRKSFFMGMLMLWLSKYENCCIASFEMKPELTLYRMCKQAIGGKPSRIDVERFTHSIKNKLYIYDRMDVVSPQSVLGMAYYAAKEMNCKHIVIDSMMKMAIPIDDYNAQADFMNKCTWIAKKFDCHVHIVIHVSKGDEKYISNRYNMFGSSQLSNIPDNVLICWKNVEKADAELKIKIDPTLVDEKIEKLLRMPDQKLKVDKQRNGLTPTFGHYFDNDSFQFTEQAGTTMEYFS